MVIRSHVALRPPGLPSRQEPRRSRGSPTASAAARTASSQPPRTGGGPWPQHAAGLVQHGVLAWRGSTEGQSNLK